MILVALLLTTILVFAQARLEAMSSVIQPPGASSAITARDALAKVSVKYLKLGEMDITDGEIDFVNRSFDIKTRLNHAVIKGMDITGDVILKGAFEDELLKSGSFKDNLSLEGKLTSDRLVINNVPVHNVKLVFRLKRGLFHIVEFNVNGNLRVYGTVYLKGENYPMDITVFATNINIGQVLSDLKSRYMRSYSGTLNAKATLKGRADSPIVKGELDIKNGNILELYFKSMTARFSGMGPILKIEDSRINKESGVIVLSGDLDIRNLGKPNAFEAIDLDGDEKDMYLSENLNIGFKDCLSEGNVDPRDKNNEVEFRYKMHEGDSLKFRLGDDVGFFGLEHKEKF